MKWSVFIIDCPKLCDLSVGDGVDASSFTLDRTPLKTRSRVVFRELDLFSVGSNSLNSITTLELGTISAIVSHSHSFMLLFDRWNKLLQELHAAGPEGGIRDSSEEERSHTGFEDWGPLLSQVLLADQSYGNRGCVTRSATHVRAGSRVRHRLLPVHQVAEPGEWTRVACVTRSVALSARAHGGRQRLPVLPAVSGGLPEREAGAEEVSVARRTHCLRGWERRECVTCSVQAPHFADLRRELLQSHAHSLLQTLG